MAGFSLVRLPRSRLNISEKEGAAARQSRIAADTRTLFSRESPQDGTCSRTAGTSDPSEPSRKAAPRSLTATVSTP